MPNFANSVARTGGLLLRHDSGSMADYFSPEDIAPHPDSRSVPSSEWAEETLCQVTNSRSLDGRTAKILARSRNAVSFLSSSRANFDSEQCSDSVTMPARAWRNSLNMTGCVYATARTYFGTDLPYSAGCTTTPLPMMGAFTSELSGSDACSVPIRLAQIRIDCDWLLVQCTSSLRREVIDGVRSRMVELMHPDNWDEGDVLPLVSSFRNLLVFLGKQPEVYAPGLTIADGHFVATWLGDAEKLVRLEFDPSGSVKWLILLSQTGTLFHPQQGVGWVLLDQVRAQLDVYGVRNWMAPPSAV